jgi:hypothetical protein
MATVIELALESTLSESYGEIVAATRSFVVTGVASPYLPSALSEGDIPQPGEALPGEDAVTVIARGATVVAWEDSEATVKVTVEYEINRSSVSNYSIRGGTSLTQVRTMVDTNGNQITVKYGDKTQGGEIEVLQPQHNISYEFVKATDTPQVFIDAWVAKVSSVGWLGASERKWLCTRGDYELVNAEASPKHYRFNIEFEKSDVGWDPTVAYKDPETGEIPPDLEKGVGIKDITWYAAKDFSQGFA